MILEMRPGKKAQTFMHCKVLKFKEGVNQLVGPNGSGKSSVLGSIKARAEGNTKEDKKERRGFLKVKGSIVTRYYDTEFMNPRTRNMMDAMGSFEMMQLWMHSKGRSHGQALGPLVGRMMDGEISKTVGKLRRAERLVMLLDEPESGLDQTALAAFADVVNKWAPKVQFILATHSVWLWNKLGGNFIILGEDRNYVQNTLKAWRRMLLVEAQI